LKTHNCVGDRYSILASVANSLDRRSPVCARETEIKGESSDAISSEIGDARAFDESRIKPMIRFARRNKSATLRERRSTG